MITPPTDRLHKFLAIGGLALVLAAAAGALRQYNETGLQEAEYFGRVAKLQSTYNRFAADARAQAATVEKLKSDALSPTERSALEAKVQRLRESMAAIDKEFAEADAEARRQEAIARHYRRMQLVWLLLAGAALAIGGFASYKGFKAWASQGGE